MKDKLVAALKLSNRFLHKNGDINVTALARESGVIQTTVKRILDGSIKSPGIENIQKICNAAGVEIEGVFSSKDSVEHKQFVSLQEKQLLAIFNNLSPKSKKIAIKLIAVLD